MIRFRLLSVLFSPCNGDLQTTNEQGSRALLVPFIVIPASLTFAGYAHIYAVSTVGPPLAGADSLEVAGASSAKSPSWAGRLKT